MARCLGPDENDAQGKQDGGIAHGLRRFADGAAEIWRGWDFIANSITEANRNPKIRVFNDAAPSSGPVSI